MYDRKMRSDLLTLSTPFYGLSVSYNLFPKAEMRQFSASGTEGLTRPVVELVFKNREQNLEL